MILSISDLLDVAKQECKSRSSDLECTMSCIRAHCVQAANFPT